MRPRTERRRRSARIDGNARQAILDAAETLIARDGFDGTSTAAIAAAAHVPKGLVFYYFPTKTDILATLFAERLPSSPLDDFTSLVAPGDPATSLVNLDDAIRTRDHRSTVLRLILREADTHPDIRGHLHRVRGYLHDATVRILQASAVSPVRPATLRACADAWVAAMFSVLGAEPGDGRPHRDTLAPVAQVVAAGMDRLG